jgi:hypothetical protein
VVESGTLLRCCGGNSTLGSNPSLSAMLSAYSATCRVAAGSTERTGCDPKAHRSFTDPESPILNNTPAPGRSNLTISSPYHWQIRQRVVSTGYAPNRWRISNWWIFQRLLSGHADCSGTRGAPFRNRKCMGQCRFSVPKKGPNLRMAWPVGRPGNLRGKAGRR